MNKKRILVVDDNELFRSALERMLAQNGFEVMSAPDGRTAQQLIGLEQFDLVVSDIRMPEVSGIELLHFIKRTKPMPVILMTGFSELSETQEAADLGADAFIPKPFRREELLKALKICGLAGESVEKDLSDDDYCKLGIEDFVSGHQIQFDIYIRISSGRYLKIAHHGEYLPIERINSYRSKNIRFLYMLKDDFRKYIGFNLTLSKAADATDTISKAKKLNLMKHTGEVILESLYINDVDKESFENARTVVETTVAVLSDMPDTLDLLNILNTHADYLYGHCLGVSLYSVLIARAMKWHSSVNLFKVSIGGLLHDIGKKEIDRAILTKPRRERTPEEVKLIESHPIRGMEILSQVHSIPGDVLQIVLQHHENCLGLGYPSRKKTRQIHPLAKLVAVADEFCHLTLKGPHSSNLSPKDAIDRMLTLNPGAFDPAYMVALSNVLKIETTARLVQ